MKKKTVSPNTIKPKKGLRSKGFALVATIIVMSMLMLLSISMLSMSSVSTRSSSVVDHQQVANANAWLAAQEALAKIQNDLGPDQRISANASILDDPSSAVRIQNPHWLASYKTTKTVKGREYPLIGKQSVNKDANSPYKYRSVYTDLRYTAKSGIPKTWKDAQTQWRDEQRVGWLVSGEKPSPLEKLDPTSDDVVTLLGSGSLGNGLSKKELENNQVLVKKTRIYSKGESGKNYSGAIAYYVSDPSQKASVALARKASDKDLQILATQKSDLRAIKTLGSSKPSYKTSYDPENDTFKENLGKVYTRGSLGLTGLESEKLKGNFHDITVGNEGLFTDTLLGGLRKDLSPLMFTKSSESQVSYASPHSDSIPFSFESNSSIIPSPRHAMVGPSFASLRKWGLMKYLNGLNQNIVESNTEVKSGGNSLYFNEPTQWSSYSNPGYTVSFDKWAENAPNLYPVMADVRWHYYFSSAKKNGQSFPRLHIIPRVCLWNPYNVKLRSKKMAVLLPNPELRRGGRWFYIEQKERKRIAALPKYAANSEIQKWADSGDGVVSFKHNAGNLGNPNGQAGILPNTDHLGFVLEATDFGPGECLVFSAKPTQGTISSKGVTIGKFDATDIENNLLSAESDPSTNHFYHEPQDPVKISGLWGDKSQGLSHYDVLQELDFDKVTKYYTGSTVYNSYTFMLKASKNGSFRGLSAQDLQDSSKGKDYPTLQLISSANGGGINYDWWMQFWGDSNAASGGQFGNLSSFTDKPDKIAPAIHQFGAKILWLHEETEGSSPPLRVNFWGNPKHVVYNPAPIANWNIRSNLAVRHPSATCAYEWYVNALGLYIHQLSPYSPGTGQDDPTISPDGKKWAKPPLGTTLNAAGGTQVPLFDLPHHKYGALSVAKLRHVQLSPFSWHPSYTVGHSLAGLTSNNEHSGNSTLHDDFDPSASSPAQCRFGSDTGARIASGRDYGYGTRSWAINYHAVVQSGPSAPSPISVEGKGVDVSDEIYAYDIAYEVNQTLFDSFFFSSIPINSSSNISWNPFTNINDRLNNRRYDVDYDIAKNIKDFESKVNDPNKGPAFCFWNSAYFLKNTSAFNVNSTSVEAWVAFLSGLRNISRESFEGSILNSSDLTILSRVFQPKAVAQTLEGSTVSSPDTWKAGRSLTDPQIRQLADAIVKQVKLRGPFISLGDFVNRRLQHEDIQQTRMGALDAAILGAKLNKEFEVDSNYTTYDAAPIDIHVGNKIEWKTNYKRQPKSQAWGTPSFLTQGDILESLAPSMTVRGDTFVIRAYGESRAGNTVKAQAWIEVIVQRTPDFYASASIEQNTVDFKKVNRATDPVSYIEKSTGALKDGKLAPINRKLGRKFKIISKRWLNKEEV